MIIAISKAFVEKASQIAPGGGWDVEVPNHSVYVWCGWTGISEQIVEQLVTECNAVIGITEADVLAQLQ